MHKIAILSLAILGVAPSALSDQNVLNVTVNSDPPGATVYANRNKKQGGCCTPLPLTYKVSKGFAEGKECMKLQPIMVRWASGVEALAKAVVVCPKDGTNQQVTFRRLDGGTRYEIDALTASAVGSIQVPFPAAEPHVSTGAALPDLPHPSSWNRMSAEDQATWTRLAPKTWTQMTEQEQREWYGVLTPSASPATQAPSPTGTNPATVRTMTPPCLLNGARGPKTLYVTFHSDPEGAMVYANEGEQLAGYAPVRLKYTPTEQLRAGKGCMTLQPVKVRWASGATASIATLQASPAQGGEQQFSFVRPDLPGRELDVQFAIARIQNTALVAAAQAQSLPVPVYTPKHCTSTLIGNQVFTNCY
jgi:hypothetical protein